MGYILAILEKDNNRRTQKMQKYTRYMADGKMVLPTGYFLRIQRHQIY